MGKEEKGGRRGRDYRELREKQRVRERNESSAGKSFIYSLHPLPDGGRVAP